MTIDEIVRSLNVCADQVACTECSFKNSERFCKNELARTAAKVIDRFVEKRKEDASTIQKLKLDKETLEEMLEQKYTKEQLVQAVNDIIEDTVTEDLSSTAQSVCAFLRLIDADGYFAILLDGTAEIRLEGESR